MSKWFPEVYDHEGADAALRGGVYGALGFAAMLIIGMAMLQFAGTLPAPGEPIQRSGAALIGIGVELALVLVCAWRFKNGKGLIWGLAIVALFALEIIGKLMAGVFGVVWLLFYAAIGAGLINGVRGAWAKRSLPPSEDYAQVFE